MKYILPTLLGALDLLCPASCLLCQKKLKNSHLCHACSPLVKSTNCTYCHRCQMPILSGPEQSCQACQLFPPLFRSMRYLWDYREPLVGDFINTMKYRPSRALARFAGDLMARHLPDLFENKDWDLVIPVPSASQSIRQRGFNQCAIFAREIAKSPSCAYKKCFNSLSHSGYKNVQASLPLARRRTNIARSFRAAEKRLKDRGVLLVEDVVTTGATSNAACRAILEAGAAFVDVFTLARSPFWNEHRSSFAKR